MLESEPTWGEIWTELTPEQQQFVSQLTEKLPRSADIEQAMAFFDRVLERARESEHPHQEILIELVEAVQQQVELAFLRGNLHPPAVQQLNN